MLAVRPAETAEIVGGSAANGFTGQFLGSVPTWNPALLDTPAAPALQALYTNVAPWEDLDADTEAHAAIRESLGDDSNENVNRTAVINKPDAEAPLGLSSVATGVTGTNADGYDYASACSG